MYEELVRCLREHAKPWNCADNCICKDATQRGYGSCSDELAKLAADAIEELTKRVPPVPHGRLIDADALFDDLLFPSKQFEQGMRELIGDAPTVVPAEEGE